MSRGGEADPVLSSVKDTVVLRQKYVSQNPQRALGGHDVHGLEPTEAQFSVTEHLLQMDTDAPSAPPPVLEAKQQQFRSYLAYVLLGRQRVLSAS